jgi:hypothetical protein
MNATAEALIEKLRELPEEQLNEVEDFVDFLRERRDERRLVASATKLSEESFAMVWDNADDAAYDRL